MSGKTEQRIDALLRSEGLADPPPDLVARIMDGLPPEESAVDRWNRIALPFALLAALAALALGLDKLTGDSAAPADPVATITTDTELDPVLALSRR
jgi:hypothetical protein